MRIDLYCRTVLTSFPSFCGPWFYSLSGECSQPQSVGGVVAEQIALANMGRGKDAGKTVELFSMVVRNYLASVDKPRAAPW
jgi:hypothetical protein